MSDHIRDGHRGHDMEFSNHSVVTSSYRQRNEDRSNRIVRFRGLGSWVLGSRQKKTEPSDEGDFANDKVGEP